MSKNKTATFEGTTSTCQACNVGQAEITARRVFEPLAICGHVSSHVWLVTLMPCGMSCCRHVFSHVWIGLSCCCHVACHVVVMLHVMLLLMLLLSFSCDITNGLLQ